MNWTENIAQMNRSALLSSLSPVFQLPHSCHMDLTVKACMPVCTFLSVYKKVGCRFYSCKFRKGVIALAFDFICRNVKVNEPISRSSIYRLPSRSFMCLLSGIRCERILLHCCTLLSSQLLSWGSDDTEHVHAQDWIIKIFPLSSDCFIFRVDISSLFGVAPLKQGLRSGVTPLTWLEMLLHWISSFLFLALKETNYDHFQSFNVTDTFQCCSPVWNILLAPVSLRPLTRTRSVLWLVTSHMHEPALPTTMEQLFYINFYAPN